jgi:hypothetical protein
MKYLLYLLLVVASSVASAQDYSTCATWEDLVNGTEHKYVRVVRISDPGSESNRFYTGF